MIFNIKRSTYFLITTIVLLFEYIWKSKYDIDVLAIIWLSLFLSFLYKNSNYDETFF